MSLPIVTTKQDQHWDCQQCGICCRGSIVSLNDKDLRRLIEQDWHAQPDFKGVAVVEPHGGGHRLAHREDGCCVFLNADGLCRIHAEHGYEAKPTMCRVFPLQLVPHESKSILTLRCACPTVALNQGQELEGHMASVKKLVKRGELISETVHPPMLKRGELHDWDVTEIVLKSIARLLTDERFPVVRRLAHALQWVELLEKNATRKLDADGIRRLTSDWPSNVVELAGEFFSERPRPGPAARVLFRLVVLEHARLLPSHRPRNTWGQRVEMMRAAWRMVRGRGVTPDLRSDLPVVRFEQINAPLGALPREVTQPLAQYVETTASSGLFALANRGGWSIVESVRSLALSYAVGMCLLRWIAVDRQPTTDDVLPVVVALDRGHGFAPLSGVQQQWRLWALQKLGGIEPLVAWWSM